MEKCIFNQQLQVLFSPQLIKIVKNVLYLFNLIYIIIFVFIYYLYAYLYHLYFLFEFI